MHSVTKSGRKLALIFTLALASSMTHAPSFARNDAQNTNQEARQNSAAMPIHADQATGHTVTVNGHSLYYESIGQGPVLLVLHGGGGNVREDFSHQIEALSPHHRIIGIERSGHGHSPDVNGPFKFADMESDTLALLDALGLSKVDVLGFSDGANLALLMASHHPERFGKLIVSGPNQTPYYWSARQMQALRAKTDEQLAHSLGADMQAANASTSPDGAAHFPVIARKLYELWMTPLVMTDRELDHIRNPVLFIAGDQDDLQPTLAMRRHIHDSRLMVLPDTGHFTLIESPDLCNAAIAAYLSSEDKPRRTH